MKKISIICLLSLLVIACNSEPKDYVSLSGKLENNKDSIITISGRTGVLKTITINNDGAFGDTLKVQKGDIYTFQTSKSKRAPVYLKNGYDITITGNAEEFMTSFSYTGVGASNSSFIIAQLNESRNLGNPAKIIKLDEANFTKKISLIKKSYDSILNSYSDLDSSLVVMAKNQNKQMIDYFVKAHETNKVMSKGKPSPKFINYVNFKGGKKSLDSFKGKYVYLDIWATWCGPCIREIPSLKELEKKYHKKNIKFVSISTDESRRSGGSWEAAEKKWRDFVKERQLSGIQLWAGEDFSFQQAYQINTIPRFILIDPSGNIVDADAPRPSEPRLIKLFDSLGL